MPTIHSPCKIIFSPPCPLPNLIVCLPIWNWLRCRSVKSFMSRRASDLSFFGTVPVLMCGNTQTTERKTQ